MSRIGFVALLCLLALLFLGPVVLGDKILSQRTPSTSSVV
jgi:hypothetical protein